MVANPNNQQILPQIAAEELRHYQLYRKYTQKEVKPNRWRIFLFTWLARIFGLTFGLKLMEKGEEQAKNTYQEYTNQVPELA